MKLAILGFGKEGQSVFKFLKRTRSLQGDELWILDSNKKTKIPRGTHPRLGKNFLQHIADFDIVFRSPGIPWNLPELKRARKAGTLFSSATKLFFGAINHSPFAISHSPTVIGITGTKGKGTTATILYNILKNAGKKVLLAGNIGTPALDILPRLQSSGHKSSRSYVILELSSFQLQDLEASPHIAVATDIFPDHQDSHKNLDEYYAAKTTIAKYQKKSDTIFFMARNDMSRRITGKSKGKKIGVDEKKVKLFESKDLKIKGEHNFRNAAMAATVAKHLGIPTQTIIKTLKQFKGNEHRLEFVRSISQRKSASGPRQSAVVFYNDSASTNPHTSAAAINAFQSRKVKVKSPRVESPHVILIAGGQDKNLDYAPLAQALKSSNTKLVILIGENKNKISKAIKKYQVLGIRYQVKIKLAKNLKEAVKLAYQNAISYKPYAISRIIFSPGSASFNMFKNYEDRGRQFKNIVHKLTK